MRRAGHPGFAVQQCSSKIYFQTILNIKIMHFWARPNIKTTYNPVKFT